MRQDIQSALQVLDVKKSIVAEDFSYFSLKPKGNGNPITDKLEFMGVFCPKKKVIVPAGSEMEWFDAILSEIVSRQSGSDDSEIGYEEELNEDTAKLLYWLRYTFVGIGQSKWVISPIASKKRYLMVNKDSAEQIIQLLIQTKDVDGKSVYGRINEEFKKDFDTCHNCFREFFEGKDDEKRLVVPTLATYLEKVWRLLKTSPLMEVSEEVKLYTNDPQTPAFNVVDLEIINKNYGTPTPVTDSWLNAYFRQDQIAAFRAWIYGTLCADFRSRQVMYWEDFSGMSGKSTFITAFKTYVESIAPNTTTAINMKSINGQFGGTQLHNKRIAFDSDVKNEHVMQGSNVHKATGGDYMGIEYKGEQPFDSLVHVYFFLAGNVGLQIDTTARHERSRVIYLRMQRPPEEYLRNQCHLKSDGSLERDRSGDVRFRADNGFEEGIKREMGAFLANCKPYYDEFSGGGNVYLSDSIQRDMQDTLVSEKQSAVEEFVRRNLVVDPSGCVPITELKEAIAAFNDDTAAGNEKIAEAEVFKHLHNTTQGAVKKQNGSTPIRKRVEGEDGGHRRVHVMVGVKLLNSISQQTGGIGETEMEFKPDIEVVTDEMFEEKMSRVGGTPSEKVEAPVPTPTESWESAGWTKEMLVEGIFDGRFGAIVDSGGVEYSSDQFVGHGIDNVKSWVLNGNIKIVGLWERKRE